MWRSVGERVALLGESVFNEEMQCKPVRSILLLSICCTLPAGAVEKPGKGVFQTLQTACVKCHNGVTTSGGLNLARLQWRPQEDENLQRWVRVYDRVATGEMPPDAKTLFYQWFSRDFRVFAIHLVSVWPSLLRSA